VKHATTLPTLMSETEAAALIGVSAGTVVKYTRRYSFPAPIWLGGRKRYDEAAVVDWLLSADRLVNPRLCGEDHPNNRWSKEFVAQAIKLHNGGKGLSLKAIGERMGVSKATVQKWVDGSRRSTHPSDVAAQRKRGKA
jgi:transposase